jgi:hypothetical protein
VGITAWIGLGCVTWAALTLVVAWVLGQMIRRRDEQWPRSELINDAGPLSGKTPSRHSPNRAMSS